MQNEKEQEMKGQINRSLDCIFEQFENKFEKIEKANEDMKRQFSQLRKYNKYIQKNY